MIPLTAHYNKCIDLQKLTELKDPIEYIFPPPTKVGRNFNKNNNNNHKK